MATFGLLFMLTSLGGGSSRDPSDAPDLQCWLGATSPDLTILLRSTQVSTARALSHLLHVRGAVNDAAFPEGLSYEEAETLMLG